MKRVYIITMVLACLLAFASVSFASVTTLQVASAETVGKKIDKAVEDHIKTDEAAGAHGLPWMNYIYRVINLIIVLGLIVYLAGGKIKELFSSRRKQIAEDLDDLQKRQAEAEEKFKAVEQSIANLEQEKKALLDEALKQGEAAKEAIIAKAHKDAEAITEQAKRTAENEALGAVDQLRSEMADLVVAAAEKVVKEKLSDEDHDKLVDDYLTKVVLN